MARNSDDDYVVMNVFGSTASGTIFGENRTDTHVIFGQGVADADKKLSIGTFNAGDLILGTANTKRITVSAAGPITFHSLGSDDTEDHVVAIDDATGLLTKRAVSTIFNNLTGQVTSVGAVTTMSTTAITDWTTPASFTGGENFLVEFSGTLYEMPWALMETYLDGVYAPLSGGGYVDLTTAQTVGGFKTFTSAVRIGDSVTYIVKDGSNNITFTDAITGTKTLAELSQSLAL